MTREILTEAPKAPVMKKTNPVAIIVVVTGLFVALMAGLSVYTRAKQNDVSLSAAPRGVTVIAATGQPFRDARRYVGVVEPWLEARIGPQLIAGFVETVLVRPGDAVKRGDVLATLDCRNAHGGSESMALQARALEERQLAMASEAARLENLVSGGFVSANEIEQKKAQASSNQSQLESLRVQLRSRNLEVSDCTLRAPFDGEVATRLADPGAFVRPGGTVVSVVDRHVLRVVVDAPEIDLAALEVGTPVEVTLLAAGRKVGAKISRRSPSANEATRTVRVEVDLLGTEGPGTKLHVPVGTSADVRVEIGDPKPAVEIPLSAAKVRGSSATIFVVDRGLARKKQVPVLGERTGSLFVGDLAEGALVVTEGRTTLSDNDRVTTKLEAASGSSTAAGGAAP